MVGGGSGATGAGGGDLVGAAGRRVPHRPGRAGLHGQRGRRGRRAARAAACWGGTIGAGWVNGVAGHARQRLAHELLPGVAGHVPPKTG